MRRHVRAWAEKVMSRVAAERVFKGQFVGPSHHQLLPTPAPRPLPPLATSARVVVAPWRPPRVALVPPRLAGAAAGGRGGCLVGGAGDFFFFLLFCFWAAEEEGVPCLRFGGGGGR